jgi:hypothetical protein
MRRLHEHYPDDAEAAIFYALALNGAVDFDDKHPWEGTTGFGPSSACANGILSFTPISAMRIHQC